jgi:hypothetical protein
MDSSKKNTTFFDEDFEVTFEEDVPFTYSDETKPITDRMTDETVVMTGVSEKYNTADIYDAEDNEEDFYSYDEEDYLRTVHNRKGSRQNMSRLLSPSANSAKYGTKTIYRFSRSVVRMVSFLITSGTLFVLAYNFWRGAAPYGDPQTILNGDNYELAAYAAVAAVILFFELIALLWSMTKMKFRDGRKVYKEDTGRGLFSFIFLYIGSYVSFLLCSFLPSTFESYTVLNGIKGALDVFGSLHNMLLGLCAAGAVFCLIRRHMN